MKIVHYTPAARFPIVGYGGTSRAAQWLGKAQAEMGHRVTYICKRGSSLPFAETVDAPENFDVLTDLTPFIPPKTDIVQLYDVFPTSNLQTLDEQNLSSLSINIPRFKLEYPFLVCVQGNGKASEAFHPCTVFVSSNHAARHNWTEYVYNGLDISEYPFKGEKERFLLFLAKACWSVKNLPGAISIANKAQIPLHVGGGKAPFWSRGVVSHGTVDGQEKLNLLQNAQALLFPIIWDEPFGIVLIEALACGTPIIATPRGSLPEIVDSSCGILANSFDELVEAIEKIQIIDPEACRDRVSRNFTHIHMAEKYLYYYSKILQDGRLRDGYPIVLKKPAKYIYYHQPSNHLLMNNFAALYLKIFK
jgi:glycosyltransferase involved in cell wall biosynthesis